MVYDNKHSSMYGSILKTGDILMKNLTTFFTMRKLVLSLILTIGSFLTLPAYAWPEVDHMNMCGAAAKTVRAYGGSFRGWQAHDNFVGYRNRAGYYYRNNCPETVAPVKKVAKKTYKKPAKKVYKKRVKKVRIAKSSKARKFKRRVKYDEHADCARVDRMNGYGSAVVVKRGNAYRPAAQVVYQSSPAKVNYRKRPRAYNYFKK